MANINFNDLSPEDKLRVENMKTLVKMYAVLKALPLELRFTNATVQEGTGLVSVDVQIFNTTTQLAVKSGTVTGVSGFASVPADVLVKIHQWIQNNI